MGLLRERRTWRVQAAVPEVLRRLGAACGAEFEGEAHQDSFFALPSRASHQLFPRLRVDLVGPADALEVRLDSAADRMLVLRGLVALACLGVVVAALGDWRAEAAGAGLLLLVLAAGYAHIRGRNRAAIGVVERALEGLPEAAPP